MSGAVFGHRSPRVCRVKMLRLGPECRRLLGRDGSERQAVCPQQCFSDRQSRCPAGISRCWNERSLRFYGRKTWAFERLHARLGGQRRRFRESCGAMLRRVVAVSSIGRARHNGILSAQPSVQNRQSCRSMVPCGRMCRSAWPGRSQALAVRRSLGRSSPGKGADMDLESHDDGQLHGARSRLRAVCS